MLFCDLVDFTPLSESRDPEEVRELLSEYFEVARTVVIRYGGTVEKFIGDAVMAVWGTPSATEEDAERAGTQQLKGKSQPVPLWRANRVLSGVGGAQRIDGLEAGFVGRDAELRLVKELFHACVQRRSPRLVSVTGAAGVGKSRLGCAAQLEQRVGSALR